MKKILIIEDDPLIARVYGSKYASAGFETCIANDGEAGLELLKTFKPDLVHLDLMVPKVNGLEIVKHIRSQPGLKTLPVVVLSNTYQNHLVKAVMAAGATELVSKATCTPRMMLEIVEKLRSRMKERPGGSADAENAARMSSEASSGSPAAGAAAASPREIEADKQSAFQADVKEGFLRRAPDALATMRSLMSPLLQAEDATARAPQLSLLCRTAHSLGGQAGIAGFPDLAQVLSALVALLGELIEKPDALTDSSLRTILDTCDFLPDLLARGTDATPEHLAPIQVLVVDDDAICRRAVRKALTRIDAATLSVDDPRVALRLLAENPFSLIFLDVEMPDLNGFDLCRELRLLPANEATPVVFVTTLAGLESRDRAFECGGNDLIAKPFLPMELAVKALSLLRRRPGL